uniref:Uncharacterized protein n=1 Tax=Anguilla anguilla TaxID=7936 RepID=A0A0E9V9T1_ANGAN
MPLIHPFTPPHGEWLPCKVPISSLGAIRG